MQDQLSKLIKERFWLDVKLSTIYKRGIQNANKSFVGKMNTPRTCSRGCITYFSYNSAIVLLLLFHNSTMHTFWPLIAFFFFFFLPFYGFTPTYCSCGSSQDWLLIAQGVFLCWAEIRKEGKGTRKKIGHELVIFSSIIIKKRSPAYLVLFLIAASSMQQKDKINYNFTAGFIYYLIDVVLLKGLWWGVLFCFIFTENRREGLL